MLDDGPPHFLNASSRDARRTIKDVRASLHAECPHMQSLRDKYVGLFSVSTMVQFLWQDDLLSVSKFLCECMDVMLGADSDDQNQTSDQP